MVGAGVFGDGGLENLLRDAGGMSGERGAELGGGDFVVEAGEEPEGLLLSAADERHADALVFAGSLLRRGGGYARRQKALESCEGEARARGDDPLREHESFGGAAPVMEGLE